MVIMSKAITKQIHCNIELLVELLVSDAVFRRPNEASKVWHPTVCAGDP